MMISMGLYDVFIRFYRVSMGLYGVLIRFYRVLMGVYSDEWPFTSSQWDCMLV